MDWYIGTEWKCERKGLCKQVLDLTFTELQKPHQVSKVIIKVDEVQHLIERPSKYLALEQCGVEQQLEMGTALTPIDCYIELLVQQMIVGERARCTIQPKTATAISFVLTLQQIVHTKEIHKLTVSEMLALAMRYKGNGVVMFKDYPSFAHDYFARAAKCLISYKPFDVLSAESDGVSGADMQALLIQIQTNLAACLLSKQRYEDVIYLTQFAESMPAPTEKCVYRRAMAFYHMKEFEAAQRTLEKVPNYKDKREFAKLQQNILDSWKASKEQYKSVVQRMFTS